MNSVNQLITSISIHFVVYERYFPTKKSASGFETDFFVDIVKNNFIFLPFLGQLISGQPITYYSLPITHTHCLLPIIYVFEPIKYS